MPYIIPESRRFFHGNDKYDISLFKDVEQYGDFRLQIRKQHFIASVKIPLRSLKKHVTCRITHSVEGRQGYYILAEGTDIDAMRAGPWTYIVENVNYPENLSQKQKLRWVKGHFTQLAMEEASKEGPSRENRRRPRESMTPPRGATFSPRTWVAEKRRASPNLEVANASQCNNLEEEDWFGQREIFLALVFGAIVAFLRRDLSLFITAVVVINSFVLLQHRNARGNEARNREIGSREWHLMRDRGEASPFLSPPLQSLAAKGGPDVEAERRAIIAAARKIERAFGRNPCGPYGSEAKDLAALYRTIAELTGAAHNAATLPSPLILDRAGMGAEKRNIFSNELKFEKLNAKTARAVMKSPDGIRVLKDHTLHRLRGPLYLEEGPEKGVKRASGPPIYEFVGFEAFTCTSKIYHAARFATFPLPARVRADLEEKESSLSAEAYAEYKRKLLEDLKKPVGGFPRWYIVNMQLLNNDQKMFGGNYNGAGFTILAYFTLSDRVIAQLRQSEDGRSSSTPCAASKSAKNDDDREEHDDVEKSASRSDSARTAAVSSSPSSSKGGASDGDSTGHDDSDDDLGVRRSKPYIHPNALKIARKFMHEDMSMVGNRTKGYFGRSKLCPKCLNADEITNVTAILRKSLKFLNGKPVLLAPQHMFYRPDDGSYMEYVIDTHFYSYMQRTLIRGSRSLYHELRMAIGFVVEGRSISELPEQLLWSIELNHLDFDALGPIEDHYNIPDNRTPGDSSHFT